MQTSKMLFCMHKIKSALWRLCWVWSWLVSCLSLSRCRVPKHCLCWPTPEPCRPSHRSNRACRPYRQKPQDSCPGTGYSQFGGQLLFIQISFCHLLMYTVGVMFYTWEAFEVTVYSIFHFNFISIPRLAPGGLAGLPASGGSITTEIPQPPSMATASSPTSPTSPSDQQLLQQMLQMFAGGRPSVCFI